MITATVIRRDITGYREIAVKVVEIYTQPTGRSMAFVEALPVNGEAIQPFEKLCFTGMRPSSTMTIDFCFLKNIERKDERDDEPTGN